MLNKYFFMNKIKLLFLFWFFYQISYATNKLDLVNHFVFPNSTKIIQKGVVTKSFNKGLVEHEKHNYSDAISIWKEVLKDIGGKKDSINLELSLKTKENIGATYNALGYYKTAAEFFLSVKRESQHQEKNDRYWINNINIGVCYMSLGEYDLAKKYFDDTKEFNPYIIFLKNLYLAKWYGLKKNNYKFYIFQEIVSKQVVNFSMYETVWEEMQLDFFIELKDTEKLNKLVATLAPKYAQKNIYLKLLINQALLEGGHLPLENVTRILFYEQEINNSNDLYLKSSYYKLLKTFYYKYRNLERYYDYDILWAKNNEQLANEKNMLFVEDFKVAQELSSIKNKYAQIELEKELIEINSIKSKIRFQLEVLVVVLCVITLLLIIRNYRKNKKTQTLKFVQSQSMIFRKEGEKLALTKNLKEKSEELTASILNIKKVALLKIQLEKIVDEKEPYNEDKDTLKEIKTCLNSFFDNYRELNLLMQKKLNVDKIFTFIKKKLPEITAKEMEVIEYIMLQFTTKEIAILMNKSEKSIEYYRAQIRKKININNGYSIEDYFNKI
jgi:hypothetical protein